MAWDRSARVNPKYRSREHVAYAKRLKAELARFGALTCTARECVMPTRSIVNPNGNAPDGLTAGHADNGVDYDGPQHRACNMKDGARRGRQRQITTDLSWLPPADKPWLKVDNHPCPACGQNVKWASQKCCSKTCSAKTRRTSRPAVQPALGTWCADCGDEIAKGKRCRPCAVEHNRVAVRNAYRIKAGIPLDAPLDSRGRPRAA